MLLIQFREVQFIAHLKKTLKPWLKQESCIPDYANADLVYNMEDVLYVYKRLYDPKHLLFVWMNPINN